MTEVEELDYVRVRHVLCVRNRTVIAFIARRLVAQVGLFCLNTRSLLGGGGWAPVYILPLHAQRFLSVDGEGVERDRCLCVDTDWTSTSELNLIDKYIRTKPHSTLELNLCVDTDRRQGVRCVDLLDIHPPARTVSMRSLTLRGFLADILESQSPP